MTPTFKTFKSKTSPSLKEDKNTIIRDSELLEIYREAICSKISSLNI